MMSYRVKRGDVLTLFGEDPADVYAGLANYGFVVGQAAGTISKKIIDDYDEDDDPQLWTRASSESIQVRLAPNKVFSKPLPLP